MRRGNAPAALALALAASLAVPGLAAAEGDRPARADVAACAAFARQQPDVPSYAESAPTSPFPFQLSSVAPWTGPVTSTPAPAPPPAPAAPGPVEQPGYSGLFGAGGESQGWASEPGPQSPRFKEAFDACMRARGF